MVERKKGKSSKNKMRKNETQGGGQEKRHAGKLKSEWQTKIFSKIIWKCENKCVNIRVSCVGVSVEMNSFT